MNCEFVGKDMIMEARSVHFVDFMVDNYPELIKREGRDYGRSTENSAIVFGPRYYSDNGSPDKEKQDAIHYLKNKFNMSFAEAVRTLCDYARGKDAKKSDHAVIKPISVQIDAGEPTFSPTFSSTERDMDIVRAYLNSRNIKMTEELEAVIRAQRYQELVNAVFTSRDCNYGEIRGTYNPAAPYRPFKGKIAGSDSDGYFIVGSQNPRYIYVTEGAIDAISLMIYLEGQYRDCDFAFASIGGVNNSAAIERIKRTYPQAEIFIAFDNDDAGNVAASQLPYKRFQPSFKKDWNEELVFLSNMEF